METQNITALNVSNYFLALSEPEEGDIISNLKLQKLVYYAQGYHLALYDSKIFNEDILAWEHGPVVEGLYHHYKRYGSDAIPKPENFDISVFNDIQSSLIKEVYQVLGQFSGWKLRNMTHDEAPWKETKRGHVIPVELMTSYFKTLLK